MPGGYQNVVTALDIGTSKICCMIGSIDAAGDCSVVGFSHRMSNGIVAGSIGDMAAAEPAVREAIAAAEMMAKLKVDEVVVNISAGNPRSGQVSVGCDLVGGQVADRDLFRLSEQVGNGADEDENRFTIHMIPLGYTVDHVRTLNRPYELHGRRLGAEVNLVTVDAAMVKNVQTFVSNVVDMPKFAIDAYAAGLATASEDELKLGVTILDIGAGTTSIATFREGRLVHVDSLPLGGEHITRDIAHGLSTPIGHAELLKVRHGSCIRASLDGVEQLSVLRIGEEEVEHTIERSALIGIIAPRVEEILEMAGDRIRAGGFEGYRSFAVVTGGASQMTGLCDLAEKILDKRVRLGQPRHLVNAPTAATGPAFSVAAGLLSYADNDRDELWLPQSVAGLGMIERVGNWFGVNF